MNEKLKGEKVTLDLINGDDLDGYNVEVKSDATTVGEQKISTKTIQEITMNHHGTGALKGAGYVYIVKKFKNKKSNTMLSLTNKGREAFNIYRKKMKQIFEDLPE